MAARHFVSGLFLDVYPGFQVDDSRCGGTALLPEDTGGEHGNRRTSIDDIESDAWLSKTRHLHFNFYLFEGMVPSNLGVLKNCCWKRFQECHPYGSCYSTCYLQNYLQLLLMMTVKITN